MNDTILKPGEAVMKAGTKNGSYVMMISVPRRKTRIAAERYATADECKVAGRDPGPMNK